MDRDVRVKHAVMCKFLLVTSSVFTSLSAFTHYGEHARMLFIPFAYVTTLAYLLSVVMSIFMLAAPGHFDDQLLDQHSRR